MQQFANLDLGHIDHAAIHDYTTLCLTDAILQALGLYVLFGRSPIGISSLVGLISQLHMKEHSLTILYIMKAMARRDVLLRHFRIVLLQVSIHGCILLCTLGNGIIPFLL